MSIPGVHRLRDSCFLLSSSHHRSEGAGETLRSGVCRLHVPSLKGRGSWGQVKTAACLPLFQFASPPQSLFPFFRSLVHDPFASGVSLRIAELEVAQAEAGGMGEEVERLQAELAAAGEERARLMNQLAAESGQDEALVESIRSLQEEVSALRGQAQADTAAAKGLRRELEEAQAELAANRAQSAPRGPDPAHLEKELHLQTQLAKHWEKEQKSVKEELKARAAEAEALQQRVAALTADAQRLEGELAGSQRRSDAAERYASSLRTPSLWPEPSQSPSSLLSPSP